MRVAWIVTLGGLVYLASPRLNAQEISTTVQRDPQAISIIQQSVAAMAPAPPSDSTARGTVALFEGSTSQSGSVQIQTLGSGQTSEILTLPEGTREVVYSNGGAKEINGNLSISPPLQAILTDQCPDFPLPLLISALHDPDAAFRYIAAESLNGTAVQHIQIWNSFASKSHLQNLAPFSLKDVWVDSGSGLPLKIAYSRRTSGGMAPAIPVEILFSKYTNVSGVLYPFQINKSMNGTPWQSITIQSVSFNTGLTGAQFQVE